MCVYTHIHTHTHTQTLLNQLDVLRLPTIDLIPRFFHELAQRQESAVKGSEKPFGNLLLTVSYLRDQSAVNVNIIQAQKLPGLDKSGKLIESIHLPTGLCIYS